MSGAGAGHQYEPYPVSWYKRDVLLFANSIGCTVDELHFLYELHPSFAVFPTYPIILPFKHTSPEVVDFYAAQSSARESIPGVPKLDSKRVVDGERHIQFFKPLPTTSEGKSFEVRGKVIGVYDKGKPGTVVETQNDLVDKQTGELYTRMTGSGFFVGQGNWGGPKGPKSQNYPPPEGKKPDAVYEHPISAEAAHLYRLNGDYNPLHATPEPGKAMGFGGAIMHGLYSWNTTCHALVKLLGGSDPANIKEYAARFASPVKPGDTLVTEIWRTGEKDGDGWEDVRFITSVKGGKACLSNGRAKMRVVGQKQSKL
ncbi:hypothetical protein BAUCODRAFT_267403 [Baudoinia panamericana UAMH 10762]|uniref:Uncharacterized protein n=1 Tax=Baudoinia panamericana (strain UAMH 10762) TaxID=717646 RepID=M2MNC8_BAUPA|nr:uncharacterized protein BAUCODRAFT_267403 [Baudoinia panamericana UAMH 10762]EMC92948.1 hypothetical protein BAUCODRAFT_267403 [Baudoinia panamericana UAMH 10762]